MERKLELGGKGNGLVWLSQNTDLGFTVPRFEIIDSSFYVASIPFCLERFGSFWDRMPAVSDGKSLGARPSERGILSSFDGLASLHSRFYLGGWVDSLAFPFKTQPLMLGPRALGGIFVASY